jgi:2-polyprenyl-3-methyl-5-hydroxy-6-metoxy-1,4-benzoquinol methylase
MTDAVLDFYEQLAEDYHLLFLDWRQSVTRQGGLLDRLLRAELGPGPHSLLDASCGIGTQALGLASQGHRVHATDLSPNAVHRAAREAASLGVPLTTGVADLRTLEAQVPGTFDGVLSCDNALPHLLTDEDLLAAARGLAAKLRPGGLLVASTRDYDRLVQERPRSTQPSVIDAPEGRRIVFQVWNWAEDGRTYTLSQFILRQRDGRWETAQRQTVYRALQRRELDAALTAAGFTRIRWHAPEETGFYQPLVTAHR